MIDLPEILDNEFVYIGKDEKWHIKDDAPEELKRQFKEFFNLLKTEDDGKIILR